MFGPTLWRLRAFFGPLTTIAGSSSLLLAAPALADHPPHAPAVSHLSEADDHAHAYRCVPEVEAAVVPGKAPLSLEAALAYAACHAPALRVAEARAAETHAGHAGTEAWLKHNPSVLLRVGPRFTGDKVGTDVRLMVSQRVELAGQQGLRRDEATADEHAAEAALDVDRWHMFAAVRRAYRTARIAAARTKTAAQFLALSERVAQATSRAVEAGAQAPVVALKAQADLATSRAAHVAAGAMERVALADLARLIGAPRGADLQLMALPEMDAPPALDRLTALAAAHSPVLRAHAAETAAAKVERDLAAREAIVSPKLGVFYAHESAPQGGPANDIVLGQLQVPLPMFDTNQRGRALAEAGVAIAAREAEIARDTLDGDVAAAHAHASAAYAEWRALDGAVQGALAQHIAVLDAAFAAGDIDVFDLLQTKRDVFDTAMRAHDAHAAYVEAACALEQRVGTPLDVTSASHEPHTPHAPRTPHAAHSEDHGAPS